jgi:putative protease
VSRKRVGKVTHYFDHINVAVLSLSAAIRLGDSLHFLGHATDFKQEITSLQIERKAVDSAKPGDDVALQVKQRVRPNDGAFKVEGE